VDPDRATTSSHHRAAFSRRAHVDGSWLSIRKAPPPRGRFVAEHRSRAGIQEGGSEVRFDIAARVASRVDAWVNRMEVALS
jgi:hypothetical protein